MYILYTYTGICATYWFSSHFVCAVSKGFNSCTGSFRLLGFLWSFPQSREIGFILTAVLGVPSAKGWCSSRCPAPSFCSLYLSSVITRTGWANSRGQDPLWRGFLLNSPGLSAVKKKALSLCSATREATIVRGPRTAMKSGPRLPQIEEALAQKRRPNTAEK